MDGNQIHRPKKTSKPYLHAKVTSNEPVSQPVAEPGFLDRGGQPSLINRLL